MAGKHQLRSGKGSKKARATAARLSAVQALYQSIVRNQNAKDLVKEYISYRLGEPIEGEEAVAPDPELFSSILSNVENRREDLEHMVLKALTVNKSAKAEDIEGQGEVGTLAARPEPLLFAIILCGAGELLAHKDIDAPVIISDYLYITHAFYEHGENKLVNAVLDRLYHLLRDI